MFSHIIALLQIALKVIIGELREIQTLTQEHLEQKMTILMILGEV
jgi:hypothetical protein